MEISTRTCGDSLPDALVCSTGEFSEEWRLTLVPEVLKADPAQAGKRGGLPIQQVNRNRVANEL